MTKTISRIRSLIEKAEKVIAPLWPMQTIIARNPLQGMEDIPFDEAMKRGDILFGSHSESKGLTHAVNREMIKWCQVFLDEGQSALSMPGRENGFYKAWRQLAPYDSSLNSTDWIHKLPEDPEEACLLSLSHLNLPEQKWEDFLKVSLAHLPGFAGYIKWLNVWQGDFKTHQNPITITDFLAVRLAITASLYKGETLLEEKQAQPSLTLVKEIQEREELYVKGLLKSLKQVEENKEYKRYDAQLVFCIDVRSEPFRLRLEREGNYETYGFAGFFGLPVSIQSYHKECQTDSCPVLLKPKHQVSLLPVCESDRPVKRHKKGRKFFQLTGRIYEDLKYNFATPFALVETMGLWCGLWMALKTLSPIKSRQFKERFEAIIKPSIKLVSHLDIPLEEQINYGFSALKMIGLTHDFSPLVVFCGHGSSTENNPYASSLDCGACGGNRGGPNGALLATLLNSKDVREGLIQKGIVIPHNTLFIGAEHNTTTDEVQIMERDDLSDEHKVRLKQLKKDLVHAGLLNSQFRCQNMGLDLSLMEAKNHVLNLSSDWSETRPEWGLAKNAAFIVGPRSKTEGLDLGGRCFLHSYDWTEDPKGESLETILTAPMVVAEWINMQYLFSSLNNRLYGSGSKITHNIIGKMGVMQGNGSDLMHGLPLQSVNKGDDEGYHEPLRLQVIVFAPRERIEIIIEKHSLLKSLFYNHWVIIHVIDPLDHKACQLTGPRSWTEH